MGDCLLLTSPIRALKEEFPGFRIAVLVESRFAECFEGNPDVEETLAVARKSQALKLLGRRFDAVINLHGGPTSLAYALMARGPHIGAAQFQLSRLYRGLLPSPEPAAHSVEATMAAFRWMGVRRSNPPPLRFEPDPRRVERWHTSLKPPYAVLHPGAPMDTKRWDARRFSDLARALQAMGLRSVLTCGPGEESAVAEAARDVPAASILLGLTIPELAEVIRGARFYAGNDSGPMHLAAAVGTPVVALWGSSDARRWHPWGVRHEVVKNPFECNPCPGYRCLVAPTPLCIESVTVAQALAAARNILNGPEVHAR